MILEQQILDGIKIAATRHEKSEGMFDSKTVLDLLDTIAFWKKECARREGEL